MLRGRGGRRAPLVVLDSHRSSTPAAAASRRTAALILRAADGRSWTVVAARKIGGEIVHELEPPGRRAAGARATLVTVDLDWARRYALMRTHTALHALCGVVWRDYGALVTGGNMEPGGGRMDFEFETDVRRAGRRDRGRPSTRSSDRAATSG